MSDPSDAVLRAEGLVKRYGSVTAIDGADFDLRRGEVLAVIGDNGAGKSSLIKVLCGATIPDEGTVWLDGQEVRFHSPLDARKAGIETVYQSLAVAPAMDIAGNLFLGRERRRKDLFGTLFRTLDRRGMRQEAQRQLDALGVATVQNIGQLVETLSGGQRQAVAVARAAMFASKLAIMDEPTAALGVRESSMVLDLIRRIRDSGLPVVLISHNMPHVFEIADRIHVHRLGKRVAVVKPDDYAMNEVVSLMTGALRLTESGELVDQKAELNHRPAE
ncbi:ATP-binding cassette domain-containing protein [Pseudonocardia spinosispora]|uniref:ATP-binding cassette domain-containing protein n=1 Tax=Pseudonocardia spinosispora TaxID=103441 RepID=UPI0003FCA202|nr:ATP-binding cassette domain-containing protein [Pseudonocardia spinosispora]